MTADVPDDAAHAMSVADLHRQAVQASEGGFHLEALQLIEQAIASSPEHSSCWNMKGLCLKALGRLPEAQTCYRRGLELKPDDSQIWSNLSILFTDMKHYQTAILCNEKAVAFSPQNAEILFNHAILLCKAQQHAQSLPLFDRVLRLAPDSPDVLFNRAIAKFFTGDFATGWEDYEARLEIGILEKRKRPGMLWRGQNFARQHLAITGEQGFGDAIWAARFLPRVKALGGRVTLECRQELIPLFESLGAADQFVAIGHAPADADWHISMCSLPGLFTPDMASISGMPYFHAIPERIERLAPLFAQSAGMKRVGFMWSGNVTFKGNYNRATGLERFLTGFTLPGVQLYSFQKGVPAPELQSYPNAPVIDLGPHLRDFADTAAAVAAMDVIIMTDSALAHLAGALGKPIWLLVGDAPSWLWFGERFDSPWYDSMTIFRQEAPGDWDAAFDAVAAKLLVI